MSPASASMMGSLLSTVHPPDSSQLSINVACKNCELLILMFSAIMFHNAKLVCFYKTAI